ncbi:cupin domain-containing protein [Bacillus sp. T33-2]|uniref:cupin domain-containing protein n=1 Tax=Bacillus sp. T33-2 TaxID=2054168 RepID=UPI0027E41EF5|nr:cupin domain-containing protein [Bacillus sp. T33-2]
MLNFLPGQELPAHNHPGTDVYLLVLSGEGTFTVDGAETKVSSNEAVHCNGEEQLAFKNTGTPTCFNPCNAE